MDLFDILTTWMLYSFCRIGYSIVSVAGFSSPVTLAFITVYNTLSVSYLLLLAVLGYLVWHKKGWVLPFSIFLSWTFVGLLFFGACWQRYGLITAFVSIFTHGGLELYAVFYWVQSLRKACLNCHLKFENDWSTGKQLLGSILAPAKFFSIVGKDVKKTWNRSVEVLGAFSHQRIKRAFVLVVLLISVSAFIETYITPLVTLSTM